MDAVQLMLRTGPTSKPKALACAYGEEHYPEWEEAAWLGEEQSFAWSSATIMGMWEELCAVALEGGSGALAFHCLLPYLGYVFL